MIMIKKKKKVFLNSILFIIIAALLFIIIKIISYRQKAFTNIQVNNSTVSNPIKINAKKKTVAYTKNDTLTDKVLFNLKVNNKEIKLKDDAYELNQRYYVNVDDFLNSLSIKYIKDSSLYTTNRFVLDISNNSYYLKDNEANKINLRGLSYKKSDNYYISINDLFEMLNFKTHWDIDNKIIYCFNDNTNNDSIQKTSTSKNSLPALIRIEDVSAGSGIGPNQDFEKFRIMGDYLKLNNIKYNITWISRYKNPKKNIDNDLLKNKTMSNVEFIYTLDYLINRGASIGLHGYTHQYGDTVSASGSELTRSLNTTEKEIRNVVESAIKTAETLNIPYDFFESPHYHATRYQQKIVSEYFNIMYEPITGYWNANPILLNDTLYVPAFVGYVKDTNGQEIADKIRKKNDFALTSVFVHPFKEFSFIKLGDIDKNGHMTYTYEDNSPIKNIISALNESGYTTIQAKQLIKVEN